MDELEVAEPRFAVCVQNTDYKVSLELRKLYRVLSDGEAQKAGLLRVVDESGEDYLYPETYFALLDVPEALKDVLLNAA